MFTYYKEEQREEHYLFVEEIYTTLSEYIPELKPFDIHRLIKKYSIDNNVEVERLFFQTRNGLKRVYSFDIALNSIKYYIECRDMI